jgi:hypothetical protein
VELLYDDKVYIFTIGYQVIERQGWCQECIYSAQYANFSCGYVLIIMKDFIPTVRLLWTKMTKHHLNRRRLSFRNQNSASVASLFTRGIGTKMTFRFEIVSAACEREEAHWVYAEG